MQQIVEIAKALARNARILIMDEPTSALSQAEVAVLFKVIRDLKKEGVSIIYISHKLEELMQIGDYITVLRDGQLVAEAPVAEVTVPWIINKMVGPRNQGVLPQQGTQSRDRDPSRGGSHPGQAGRQEPAPR